MYFMNIHILYIHGIGSQDNEFYKTLHNSVDNYLDNDDITIQAHGIYWYDRYKCFWKDYVKVIKGHRKYPIITILLNIILLAIFITLFTPLLGKNQWLFDISNSKVRYLLYVLSVIFLIVPIFIPLFKYSFQKVVDPYVIEVIWYSRSKRLCSTNSEYLEKPVLEYVEEKMNEEISKIPDNEPFIIVSHSLGSVIAFDYLYSRGYLYMKDQEEGWTKKSTKQFLGIVSMGSPISIFAAALGFVPSKLQLGSTSFNSEKKPFWINLQDYDDPVARDLAPHFPNIRQLVDKKVNTGPSIISHVKYWRRIFYFRFLDYIPYFKKQSPAYLISEQLNVACKSNL